MIDQKLFLIFFISILVTFFSITILRPFAKELGVVDKPSKRKKHSGDIPLIGGISIFIGFNIALIGEYTDNNIIIAFISGSFFIFLLGLIDDCYPLSAKLRIFTQIIIVSLMVWYTELKLETFGHSFGLSNQINLGIFSYPITILGIVFVTNSYNLMDGADGVASALVLLALISISIVIILSGLAYLNPIIVALIGSLMPFIWFNLTQVTKNKIFLGDSGSLFLGYIIACLLLLETQVNKTISTTYALWIIAIPIFDALSVFVHRIKKSQALFVPDRSHLHHFMQEIGLSTNKVLYSIIGLGLFLLLIGIIIENWSQVLSLPIFILLLVIYIWFRVFAKTKNFNKNV